MRCSLLRQVSEARVISKSHEQILLKALPVLCADKQLTLSGSDSGASFQMSLMSVRPNNKSNKTGQQIEIQKIIINDCLLLLYFWTV